MKRDKDTKRGCKWDTFFRFLKVSGVPSSGLKKTNKKTGTPSSRFEKGWEGSGVPSSGFIKIRKNKNKGGEGVPGGRKMGYLLQDLKKIVLLSQLPGRVSWFRQLPLVPSGLAPPAASATERSPFLDSGATPQPLACSFCCLSKFLQFPLLLSSLHPDVPHESCH